MDRERALIRSGILKQQLGRRMADRDLVERLARQVGVAADQRDQLLALSWCSEFQL